MRANWLHILVLATATVCFSSDQPKTPKLATTASGVFLGKSGKPMAGARLILCEAIEDQAKIRLLPNVPTTTTDAAGKFTLKGFTPGRWTILYLPRGVNAAVPNEIDISALEAADKSPMPLLNRVEIGTTKPAPARAWAGFTLLQGHTFWAMNQHMKIWNATVRRGSQGPFLELRRGRIWLENFDDKGQIKFEAWSY